MGKFNLKILLLLSCGHMVVDIYQGALPAILPFLKENMGLSYTVTGVILIMSNVTSSIIQPLFGFLSDKKDKGYLLPLGAFLAGIGFMLLSMTNSFAVTLCLVALSGMGVASYHPEGFKIARFFTGQRMVTGMSYFSVGGNLGVAIGPILALSIIHYLGFTSLPWMVIPSLLFTVAIILLHKLVALPAETQAPPKASSPQAQARTRYAMLVIIAIIIVRTWMQMGLVTYIPFYVMNVLKEDPVFAGKLVSMFLLGGAFGTLAGAPLADRWGHRFWLRLSLIGSAVLFPSLLFLQGYALLAVLTFMGALLISTFSVTVVMGQNLMPHNLGVASGLLVGFAIGAGGIGVTLLGVLADHFGVPFAFKFIGVFPVVGFLLTFLLKYPQPKPA